MSAALNQLLITLYHEKIDCQLLLAFIAILITRHSSESIDVDCTYSKTINFTFAYTYDLKIVA